jgi:hypothetical protein
MLDVGFVLLFAEAILMAFFLLKALTGDDWYSSSVAIAYILVTLARQPIEGWIGYGRSGDSQSRP